MNYALFSLSSGVSCIIHFIFSDLKLQKKLVTLHYKLSYIFLSANQKIHQSTDRLIFKFIIWVFVFFYSLQCIPACSDLLGFLSDNLGTNHLPWSISTFRFIGIYHLLYIMEYFDIPIYRN
jgi:hypothetical protein